jgi:hypothetical protein
MMRQIALSLIFGGFFVFQISAQTILKDGKIPKDLVITLSLSGSIPFAAHYDLKITSDGKVYVENLSGGLPKNERGFNEILGIPANKKQKTPKQPQLKDKLSKTQLKRIIANFENFGFFEISRYYTSLGQSNMNDCTMGHVERKGLSITVNGQTGKASFFKCYTDENSPVKKLFELYAQIERELSGVKRIDTNVQKPQAK